MVLHESPVPDRIGLAVHYLSTGRFQGSLLNIKIYLNGNLVLAGLALYVFVKAPSRDVPLLKSVSSDIYNLDIVTWRASVSQFF